MLAGIIGVLASRNRPTGNVGNDWLFRAPDSIYDDTGKGFPVAMADDSPPFGAAYQDAPPFNFPVTMKDDGRYFGALYGLIIQTLPVTMADDSNGFGAISATSPTAPSFGVNFTEADLASQYLEASLDAGNALSYDGGQAWYSTILLPPSGASTSSYYFALGADLIGAGHDPEFVGSIGSSTSYFSLNGLQFFTIRDTPAIPYFQQMHYTNKRFTIVMWMRYSAVTTNVAPMFDSGTTDQGGTDMSRGVIYADLGDVATGVVGPGVKHRFRLKNSSGGGSATEIVSDAELDRDRINMIAISCASNVTNGSFLYKNGEYDPVGGLNTFTVTPESTGLLPAAVPRLGARGDAAFKVGAGTRLYMIHFYDEALTKDQLDGLFGATRSRFSI